MMVSFVEMEKTINVTGRSNTVFFLFESPFSLISPDPVFLPSKSVTDLIVGPP
jgi:hypothetical protein